MHYRFQRISLRAPNEGEANMHDMMSGMGWGMMGFMGLVGLAILLLVIAALVKYVFFR